MILRYPFMSAASAAVGVNWLIGRALERAELPTWWTWFLLGAALVAATRALARDSPFLHGLVPGVVGTWVPVLGWWAFWDARVDLQYHLGIGLGFGLIVGGLAAASIALARSTNPQE